MQGTNGSEKKVAHKQQDSILCLVSVVEQTGTTIRTYGLPHAMTNDKFACLCDHAAADNEEDNAEMLWLKYVPCKDTNFTKKVLGINVHGTCIASIQ